MSNEPWLMRVENGLSAHFKQAEGPSRPGVAWTVGFKRGNEVYTATVKGLLADDATPETRANQPYQAQTVMQYLNDQLNQGWHPSQPKEHTIYISNPRGSLPAQSTKKPWWKIW